MKHKQEVLQVPLSDIIYPRVSFRVRVGTPYNRTHYKMGYLKYLPHKPDAKMAAY